MVRKKEIVTDVAIENLKAFAQKGAKFSLSNVPTGHFNLDFALHFGQLPNGLDLSTVEGYDASVPLGLPLGRVVEIYGDTGSGKSSICYRVIGHGQRLGYPCMWVDAEKSFSESLAKINGVNLDELYIVDKSFNMENHLDNVCVAIKSGIKIIIIDSIAGLVPSYRMENNAEDQTRGLKARILSEMVPKIATIAAENDCLVIFINQIRKNLKVVFGDNNTTPGGEAVPFFSSIRLNLFKRESKKEAIFIKCDDSPTGTKYIGHYSGLKIDKNRFGKPLVDSDGKPIILDIPIYMDTHNPNIAEIVLDSARQLDIISVRKGVYKFDDKKYETREELLKLINDCIGSLVTRCKKIAKEKKLLLPPEIETFVPGTKVSERIIKQDDAAGIENELEEKTENGEDNGGDKQL